MPFANRNSFHFTLRVPDELRAKVRAATQKSGRSMNSEIIFLLSKALEQGMENEKSGTSA